MPKGWADGRTLARLRTVLVAMYGSDCWLCGLPINLTIAWPHPSSFSVDHVIPRSKGGTDALDNLRPSHLGCNSRRGNRNRIRSTRRPHVHPFFR